MPLKGKDSSREAKGQRQRSGPCRPLFGTGAGPGEVGRCEIKAWKLQEAHSHTCPSKPTAEHGHMELTLAARSTVGSEALTALRETEPEN